MRRVRLRTCTSASFDRTYGHVEDRCAARAARGDELQPPARAPRGGRAVPREPRRDGAANRCARRRRRVRGRSGGSEPRDRRLSAGRCGGHPRRGMDRGAVRHAARLPVVGRRVHGRLGGVRPRSGPAVAVPFPHRPGRRGSADDPGGPDRGPAVGATGRPARGDGLSDVAFADRAGDRAVPRWRHHRRPGLAVDLPGQRADRGRAGGGRRVADPGTRYGSGPRSTAGATCARQARSCA